MPPTSAKEKLSHVLWLGGAPVAGKTSISDLLAEKHKLQAYHFDGTSSEHTARVNKDLHPALAAFIAMTMDERWLRRPPDVMATSMIENWTERFSMVIDDLLAMPTQPRIVAEGNAFSPECVAPLLTTARQAVWLVPTPAFIARSHRGGRLRRTAFVNKTSSPDRALSRLIRRNELLAAHIKAKASALGLTVIEVDEQTPLAETYALAERHFGLAPVS
jgi:hypothetical protein